MNSAPTSFSVPRVMVVLAILLVVPALVININLLAFIDDEAIRALVAQEMMLSGNYITPTLNGAFYYNKPPLYNWMLIPLYSLFSKPEEWMSRVLTVAGLLLFCLAIYKAFSPHYGRRAAALTALAFLTTGRVLFWESFLGLIDMWFSLAMFWLFIVVYRGYARSQPWLLFMGAYALAAAGFLFKGLPALVFLSATLVAGAFYFKQWRRLFSWQHAAGIALLAALLGTYYSWYSRIHGLDQLWFRLFDESAKRTPVQRGIAETLLHLISFPAEVLYHFLPWTLFAAFLAIRPVRTAVLRHPLTGYVLLVFLINIIPYWLSPEVYPRYLLMLIPLLLGPSMYAGLLACERREKLWQVLMILLLLLMVVTLPALAAPAFWDRLAGIPGRLPKTLFLLFMMGALIIVAMRMPNNRVWAIIPFLLLVRIGFDWFVIPDRVAHDLGHISRESAKRIALKTRGEKLYIYGESVHGVLNDFHLTAERGEILRRWTDQTPDPSAWYLVDPHVASLLPHEVHDSMPLRHDTMMIRLVRIPGTDPDN